MVQNHKNRRKKVYISSDRGVTTVKAALLGGLFVCAIHQTAFAQTTPSVLGLKIGMDMATVEAVIGTVQPKLTESSVMTHNPINNGAPTKEFIKATSQDAKGNSTLWLRFSLSNGRLESVNYNHYYISPADYPSLSSVTQSLVSNFGPYSMKLFGYDIWQYDHSGKILPAGHPGFASSKANPNCTLNDYMGEQGNVNGEINQEGRSMLNEMYDACDLVYQFQPVSGDHISISSFTEDLISYKALEDEVHALIPALQTQAQQRAQQEQNQAAANKPAL